MSDDQKERAPHKFQEKQSINLRVDPVDILETQIPEAAAGADESFKTAALSPVKAETLTGDVVDARFRLDSAIGSGATSDVYAAYDLQTKLPVALKILHKHLCTDMSVVERFLRESKTASILAHPNIAKVLGCGQTSNGQPYMVLELVDGKNLQQSMESSGGWLPWEKVVEISVQVCAALAAAHQQGIVHRDIKPTNIMISKNAEGQEFVKVLDFGIAKVLPAQGETYFKKTQAGETLGSLLYMSPEQCLDEDVDGRTDVYSLGCVMYEALVGKPAFSGRTAFLTMNQHLTSTADSFAQVRPDLSLPGELETLIFKAIATKPADRFQKINQLGDALRAVKSTEFAGRAPTVYPKPLSLSTSNHHVMPKSVMASVVLLFAFAAVYTLLLIFSFSLPMPNMTATDRMICASCFGLMIVYLVFSATKIIQRRSWARIAHSFFTLMIIGSAFEGARTAPSVDVWLTALLVLGIAPAVALWLLWSKSASAWFKGH